MEQRQPFQSLMPCGGAEIDAVMDRASRALLERSYFEAERLCVSAMRGARAENDLDRLARVTLPMMEIRRQKRQLALDAARERGVQLVNRVSEMSGEIEPGCYLIRPPSIGLDAKLLRERADAAEVPVYVLASEPMTRAGLVPVVGVGGGISVRARISPPVDLAGGLDGVVSPSLELLAWFEEAGEALGDAGIESVPSEDPALWRVDDLLERLEAVPDHEKLHQRLIESCRAAMREPAPAIERRRGVDDPYSF